MRPPVYSIQMVVATSKNARFAGKAVPKIEEESVMFIELRIR